MDITQSKGLPEPEEIRTLIVYDSANGKIAHKHIVVTYPGGKKHTQESLHSRALEMAKRVAGVDPKRMRVLSVRHDEMHEGHEYSVDVARGALVKGRRYDRHEAE